MGDNTPDPKAPIVIASNMDTLNRAAEARRRPRHRGPGASVLSNCPYCGTEYPPVMSNSDHRFCGRAHKAGVKDEKDRWGAALSGELSKLSEGYEGLYEKLEAFWCRMACGCGYGECEHQWSTDNFTGKTHCMLCGEGT